jgi:hypothetical protein
MSAFGCSGHRSGRFFTDRRLSQKHLLIEQLLSSDGGFPSKSDAAGEACQLLKIEQLSLYHLGVGKMEREPRATGQSLR